MKLKQSREKLTWYFKTNKQINKQTKNRKKKREIGQCPNWIDVLSTLQEVRDTHWKGCALSMKPMAVQ